MRSGHPAQLVVELLAVGDVARERLLVADRDVRRPAPRAGAGRCPARGRGAGDRLFPGSSRASSSSESAASSPTSCDARARPAAPRPSARRPGRSAHGERRQERGLAAGGHDRDPAGLLAVARRPWRRPCSWRRRASTRGSSRRAPPPARPPRRPGRAGSRARPRRCRGSPRPARCARLVGTTSRIAAHTVREYSAYVRWRGVDEDGVRAAPQRLGAAHRRTDTVRAGDVVSGSHDAPAAGVTSHDERLCCELGALELLHGCEEGVQVEMRDDHHGMEG